LGAYFIDKLRKRQWHFWSLSFTVLVFSYLPELISTTMLEHTIIDGVNAASSSSQGQPTLQPLRRHQNHYMEDTFMIFQVRVCFSAASMLYAKSLFQVENVLFRVPTYLLSKESELFAGMFKLPQPGENTEGSSDSNPVVLPSELSSEDFGNLLEALYPLYAFSILRAAAPGHCWLITSVT